MTIRLAGVAVVAIVCAHAALAAGAEVVTWKVDGEARQAIVFPPSAPAAGDKAPLVFSFHGRGDDMKNFQGTDMHRAWPQAVVVYFQGLPGSDGVSGWQVERGQNQDRDLKLVDAALAALRQRFSMDEARIYATGFSNGAMFTYLLWAERPGVFAAYAPVAGRLRPSVQLKPPKPIIHVAGTQDRTISFAAQTEAIEAAKRADGVTGAGAPCGGGCTIYGSGSAAPVVTLIHPGGHDYPDGTSERIAGFFRDHPFKP